MAEKDGTNKESFHETEKNTYSLISTLQHAKNASLKLVAEKTQKYLSEKKDLVSNSPPISPRSPKEKKTLSKKSSNDNSKKMPSVEIIDSSNLKKKTSLETQLSSEKSPPFKKKNSWDSYTNFNHNKNTHQPPPKNNITNPLPKKSALDLNQKRNLIPNLPKQNSISNPNEMLSKSAPGPSPFEIHFEKHYRTENNNFQNVYFERKILTNKHDENHSNHNDLKFNSDFEKNTYYFDKKNHNYYGFNNNLNNNNEENPNVIEDSNLREIVEINCGGKIFMTFKSTLLSKPESMIASMFSGRFPMTKDSKGRIFIDRNPKTFEKILDYLRTGQTACFLDFPNQEFLLRELEYFGLTTPSLLLNLPLQSITWDISTKSEEILVHDRSQNPNENSSKFQNCDNSNIQKKKSITCTSHKGWKSIFSSESFSEGKSTHIFRIDDNSGGCLIGIATENFEKKNLNSENRKNTYCGCDDFSWALQSDCGFTFHRTVYRPYVGRPLKKDDVVEMAMDLEHCTLSFVINGVDYGVAFSRLPKKQTFYVCVSLSGENTTLSVLSPF